VREFNTHGSKLIITLPNVIERTKKINVNRRKRPKWALRNCQSNEAYDSCSWFRQGPRAWKWWHVRSQFANRFCRSHSNRLKTIFYCKISIRKFGSWRRCSIGTWQKNGTRMWGDAYLLFLSCSPLHCINKELGFHSSKNQWNDYNFTIQTPLPNLGRRESYPLSTAWVVGYYEGVDKRAMMIVLSRERKVRNVNNVSFNLGGCPECVGLTIQDKLLINLAVSQMHGLTWY
jgi:hypothetical protein